MNEEEEAALLLRSAERLLESGVAPESIRVRYDAQRSVVTALSSSGEWRPLHNGRDSDGRDSGGLDGGSDGVGGSDGNGNLRGTQPSAALRRWNQPSSPAAAAPVPRRFLPTRRPRVSQSDPYASRGESALLLRRTSTVVPDVVGGAGDRDLVFGGHIVYWMSRCFRRRDNLALRRALSMSGRLSMPLLVVAFLTLEVPRDSAAMSTEDLGRRARRRRLDGATEGDDNDSDDGAEEEQEEQGHDEDEAEEEEERVIPMDIAEDGSVGEQSEEEGDGSAKDEAGGMVEASVAFRSDRCRIWALRQLQLELRAWNVPLLCFSLDDPCLVLSEWALQNHAHVILTDFSADPQLRFAQKQLASRLQCPLFVIDSDYVVAPRVKEDVEKLERMKQLLMDALPPLLQQWQLPELSVAQAPLLDLQRSLFLHDAQLGGASGIADMQLYVPPSLASSTLDLEEVLVYSGEEARRCAGERVAFEEFEEYFECVKGGKAYSVGEELSQRRGISALMRHVRMGTLSAVRVAKSILDHGAFAATARTSDAFAREKTKMFEVLLCKREYYVHHLLRHVSMGLDGTVKSAKFHVQQPEMLRVQPFDRSLARAAPVFWRELQLSLCQSGQLHPLLVPHWVQGVREMTSDVGEALWVAVAQCQMYLMEGVPEDLFCEIVCHLHSSGPPPLTEKQQQNIVSRIAGKQKT